MIKTKARSFSASALKERVILIITLIALVICSDCFGFPAAAESEAPLFSKRNYLRTSDEEDNCALIETHGDSISIKGKYKDAKSIKIKLYPKTEFSEYSFHAFEDGSFEAELTAAPYKNECYILLIIINGEASKSCYIMYEDGWCFVDNRLEESNRRVFDNIYTVSDEACCLYLNAEGDPDKINFVKEQLKLIVKDVTAGIDSDYEKARALEKYVAENYCYDFDAKEGTTDLESISVDVVLRDRRSVCLGISNLYMALLEAAGIKAVNIKGSAIYRETPFALPTEGQNHEWVAFYYEEEQRWVWTDPVWGGLGDYKKGEYYPGKYNGNYFDRNDFALSINHRADRAERRPFFEAEIPEKLYTAPEAEAPEETEAETTYPAEAPETAPTDKMEAEKERIENEVSEIMENAHREDNTILIAAVIVISLLIAVLIAVIIKLFRNGRKI